MSILCTVAVVIVEYNGIYRMPKEYTTFPAIKEALSRALFSCGWAPANPPAWVKGGRG